MKVAYYEVEKKPVIIDIKNTLEEMQKLVDGYVQSVYITDGVYLICNEDGLILDLPRNRHCRITGGYIRGNFFLCGLNYNGDDFDSISVEGYNSAKEYFV